jgi:large repetitive protein
MARAVADRSRRCIVDCTTTGAHRKVVVNADSGLVYTPSAAFVGTDSFTYTVSGGGATSEPGKVTIVVK